VSVSKQARLLLRKILDCLVALAMTMLTQRRTTARRRPDEDIEALVVESGAA
jgi:hypothetical protein